MLKSITTQKRRSTFRGSNPRRDIRRKSSASVTKDKLTYSEALAYLDLADGDVDGAIANVCEDFGWSAEEEKIETLIARASRIIKGDRRLTYSEVRAYLIMADWDVSVALGIIREDFSTS